MKRMLGSLLGLLTSAVMSLGFAAENLNGESLYNEVCAMCHAAPTDERTPRREALATYTANSVFNSLTQGIMAPQGASLTNEQKIALAEYLTDSRMQADTIAGLARCQQEMPELDLSLSGNWNGWGNGDSNPRFQSAEGTAISASTLSELEFVWALGLENASAARAQPSVINTVMFMGSTSGTVYAMDIKSGCAYWTYQAPQEVRAAVTIAWSEQRNEHLAVIAVASNDLHVVNAVTGELLWQSEVDPHPFARSTGSPVVSGDRIFVPVSSAEVSAAGRPDHHCCTFRGNVAAFDLSSGEKVWHTYIMEEATQVGINSAGNPVMAPSGAPIWQAPSMDVERGVVYAGSGQNYTRPASHSSDAVIAFDMASGQSSQLPGCRPRSRYRRANYCDNIIRWS
jgi:polyvinyl alcohol dehydrogenase (cytochrome)